MGLFDSSRTRPKREHESSRDWSGSLLVLSSLLFLCAIVARMTMQNQVVMNPEQVGPTGTTPSAPPEGLTRLIDEHLVSLGMPAPAAVHQVSSGSSADGRIAWTVVVLPACERATDTVADRVSVRLFQRTAEGWQVLPASSQGKTHTASSCADRHSFTINESESVP